jgi:hypothetical protein
MKTYLTAIVLSDCAAQAQADTILHVSPSGNDTALGGAAYPLQTLVAAQKAARQAKADGRPMTIYLHAGIYYQSKPLVLTAEDSGTADAPVAWEPIGPSRAVRAEPPSDARRR